MSDGGIVACQHVRLDGNRNNEKMLTLDEITVTGGVNDGDHVL